MCLPCSITENTYLDLTHSFLRSLGCPRYQTHPNHQYGGCLKHKVCATGEFVKTLGTPTRPQVCASHTACGAEEWESKAPVAGSTDRECTELSVRTTSCSTLHLDSAPFTLYGTKLPMYQANITYPLGNSVKVQLRDTF